MSLHWGDPTDSGRAAPPVAALPDHPRRPRAYLTWWLREVRTGWQQGWRATERAKEEYRRARYDLHDAKPAMSWRGIGWGLLFAAVLWASIAVVVVTVTR